MQLHSLTVAGLRCFRNPVTLAEFDPGANIIFGPNELGKSTLIWGLILAFCNRHDVGGEGILSYRPWGTDLSPQIDVEFSVGGQRYRLQKGFLDRASSILSEQVGENYLALAEGKSADERVRKFMLAKFPGRGLTKNPDWGLAHLLWVPQDKERFTSPRLSRPVEDHFRQAAGATIFTARDDRLLQLIENRYASIYTPKTGVYQAGSEICRTETRLHELAAELKQAERELEEISACAAELQQQENLARAVLEEVRDLDKKHQHLLGRIEKVKELRAQIKTATAQAQAAKQHWQALDQDLNHLAAWERKQKAAALEIAAKKDELTLQRPQIEQLKKRLDVRRKDVDRLTTERKEANRKLAEAYKLNQSISLLRKIDQLQHAAATGDKIETDIVSLKAKLASKPVPTALAITTAQKLQRQIEIAQGQALAQGLRLDFRPLKELEVTVITTEGRTVHSISPARPLRLDVSAAEVELEIASIGRLKIASGAKELKGILARLQEGKGELAGILTAHRADSVDELLERFQAARDIRRRIDQLLAQRADILGEYGSWKELNQARAEKQKQLKQQCLELGLEVTQLRSITPADTAQLEQQARLLEQQEQEAKEDKDLLEANWRQAETRRQTLEHELNRLRQLIQTAIEEKEKMLARHGGQKSQLQQDEEQARQEKTQQEERLTQLAGKLPPDADFLERDAFRLAQVEEQKKQQLAQLKEEIAALRAQIDLKSEAGLYSKISRLEEEYELERKKYDRLKTTARAIKLLHRLAHARHGAMLADLTEPIRQGLNDLFQQVTQRSGRSLELGADLTLSGLKVKGEQPLQPLAAFSIGTQEQMLLLARLALAQFLSSEGRQLVVLDDALVNSDRLRRRRILQLLEKAAKDRFQLLILTCHPEMYDQLPGKRYDLASLL